MPRTLHSSHASPGQTTYRKPYKKSTTGCEACKSRKIKCDEGRPACGNCRRRFKDDPACQYPQRPRHTQRKGLSLMEDGRTIVAGKPVALDSTNVLALRLMHHYTRTTSLSRPPDSGKRAMARSLWADDIPRIAFTSKIVMTALLGISAWHLWALNPDDQTLAIASRSYFGDAIKLQRTALEQHDVMNNDRNIESLFVAGFILAHHNWLLTQTGEHVNRYDLSLETFYMCNGYRLLAAKNLSLWSKYFTLGETCSDSSEQLVKSSPQDSEFMQRAVQDNNSLLQYIADAAAVDPEDKKVYGKAIHEIWWICSLIAEKFDDISVIEYSIVTFLHHVPPRFVELLEKKDPIAAALLARPFALLHLLEDTSSWWIHGTDRFRVDRFTVLGVKHLLSPDWHWIMDWPLSIVSSEVKLH